MYPARMTAHQENVRRACERFPLLRKGMVLENRYEVMQDSQARSPAAVRDRQTGQFVTVTVFADVVLWDMVQAVLERIKAGQVVINLPEYTVKATRRRPR